MKVDWYNFATVHNSATFRKKYGFSPIGKSVQLWKAIKGDNSDCIVNAVPHLRNEILLDILNRFKDVDDLFNNLWETDYPEKWKIRIKEVEANIRLNYKLVDYILLNEDINDCIYLSKENHKILKFWFDTLSLPLDANMYKKSKTRSFFERKKYKRI